MNNNTGCPTIILIPLGAILLALYMIFAPEYKIVQIIGAVVVVLIIIFILSGLLSIFSPPRHQDNEEETHRDNR